MGVVTARAAGVEEVVVLTPPPIAPVIRGTCALCGVHEVYAMGGAHGVAALAFGTETIARVDVIAGPGSLIVQEAKRQVSDSVGIDGFYGPSDVLVLADDERRRAARRARPARPGRARAGRAGRRASATPSAWLDALAGAARGARAASARQSDPAAFVLAHADVAARRRSRSPRRSRPSTSSSSGPAPSGSRAACARAGCVFVGAAGATAFGDYVAGSNHSLPTGGSARFASGLSARHFRRRFSEVHIGDAAAGARRGGRADRPRGGLRRARRVDGGARRGESRRHEPLRRARPRDEGDAHPAVARRSTARALGARRTGVGFLDHMLDLLARHARLDLDVAATGDLHTGAHHTVEDVGIVFGQALDTALGDRAGIYRYGHAVVPMDEARALCAIDISGRPYCVVDAPGLPPGETGGFEHELLEEFFRAVANNARMTLHIDVQAGTNAHHIIEVALQGVRARAARARSRSTRRRPACRRRRGR